MYIVSVLVLKYNAPPIRFKMHNVGTKVNALHNLVYYGIILDNVVKWYLKFDVSFILLLKIETFLKF